MPFDASKPASATVIPFPSKATADKPTPRVNVVMTSSPEELDRIMDDVDAEWKTMQLAKRRDDWCKLVEYKMRMLPTVGAWSQTNESEYESRRHAEAELWKQCSMNEIRVAWGWSGSGPRTGRQWEVSVFAEARLALGIDPSTVDAIQQKDSNVRP
jgi:hypothetical protein